MSYLSNKPQYIDIVSSFVSGKSDADEFCGDWARLWTEDRDKHHRSANSLEKRQLIVSRLKANLISRNEADAALERIITEELQDIGHPEFLDLIDKLLTACDCTLTDEELLKEDHPEEFLSETQLRAYAETSLREYQEATSSVPNRE